MTKLIQVGNRNRKNGNGSRRGSFQVGGGVRGGGAQAGVVQISRMRGRGQRGVPGES